MFHRRPLIVPQCAFPPQVKLLLEPPEQRVHQGPEPHLVNGIQMVVVTAAAEQQLSHLPGGRDGDRHLGYTHCEIPGRFQTRLPGVRPDLRRHVHERDHHSERAEQLRDRTHGGPVHGAMRWIA